MTLLPIHQTFAPHVDWKYALRSVIALLHPWCWKRGGSTRKLKRSLSKHFDADAFLFSSGREALLALLRAMDLKSSEQIIIQGYTCVVVPNAIHAAGGSTVYADIDPETLNLNPATLEKLITDRTRAIICQHTFGIPAPMEALKALCKKHKIFLIEDAAHIIPDEDGPKQIGSHGHFVLLSFGRDKAISGVTGGAIISRKSSITEKLEEDEKQARHLSGFTIHRFLLYPFVYWCARFVYRIGIGKALLLISKKIKLLLPIVSSQEKSGHMDPVLHKLPNACAQLVRYQWKRLKKINDHRRQLAAIYSKADLPRVPAAIDGLPLQKYPLIVNEAEHVRSVLKKKNIHLEDGWSRCIVCPSSTKDDLCNYIKESCPHAERISQQILTLPTHPTTKIRQARKVVKELKKLL